MNIEVRNNVPVEEKLQSFGISFPSDLAILPCNLVSAKTIDDLRQHVESDTVRTLLNVNKIPYVEIFDKDQQPSYLQQYSFDWFGPTILIPAYMLSQNPDVLSVIIGMITNYLYDLFKGSNNGNASLDIILQQADGTCKEVHYNGPADKLNEISKIAAQLVNEK